MTPEKQRIAIAKACGWRGISEQFLVGYNPSRLAPYEKRILGNIEDIPLDPLPDYLNDLNAMAKAEELLLPDDAQYSQCNFYASELGQLTLNDNNRGWQPLSNDDCFPLLHAKASQRAEAFLRTLELWES
jgi:hypothetical protein